MLVRSQLTVPCTEETNEIQVASEEELPRDSLGLPPEPGREQAVEADAAAAGRGPGGAGAVGQTARAPAARLAGQENRDAEDLEREQLVIPDGQEEEEQDAAEEGGCAALWVVSGLRSSALGRTRAGPLRRAPPAIWWFLFAGEQAGGGRKSAGSRQVEVSRVTRRLGGGCGRSPEGGGEAGARRQ